MDDYIKKLKGDLVEQFRGKRNIEALLETVGKQLQDIADFYEQLRELRAVHTAVGTQLDGVGDIVGLTRSEAGVLAGINRTAYVLDDELYRQFLVYKIWRNTNSCTYPDIINSLRMFWDKPLYYQEDPKKTATIIIDTGDLPGDVDTSPLLRVPLIRAAGITLKLQMRTSVDIGKSSLLIRSGLGFAITSTKLPDIEHEYRFRSITRIRSGFLNITESIIPNLTKEGA